MFNRTGKRFLVTGAGSPQGIGFASARALKGLGASVFLTSLSPRAIERASELNAFGAIADLTDADEVSILVETAVATLGSLDGVINNAGMTSVIDEAIHGITVNAVAPGWIDTESQTDSEYQNGLATPMGRSGSPDEIASAIAWLCTPGASYITAR